MKCKVCLALWLGFMMTVAASAAEPRIAVISLSHVIRAHPDVKPN